MNINPLLQSCRTLQYQIGNVEQWIWPISDNVTFGIIVQDWVQTIQPFLEENFGKTGTGTVIQAGGNCGVYPLLYTEFFKTVITFEPDPLSFFCLVHNCQVPGIVKLNAALFDKSGNIVMQEIASGNRGMNKTVGVNETASNTIPDIIPAMAIDSLEYFDLKLIQLDLEGNEIKAIDGAINTIKKHKPVIILECGNEYHDGIEQYMHTVAKMESIGYKKVKQLNRLDVVFLPA